MKKIAIIGASCFQEKLICKAKDMGCETHVFAWETGDPGERMADFFYPISIREQEEILHKCKEIGINGITSIGSDLAMQTVNYVAEKMGLTGNSMRSTMKSTNKHLMRNAFQENGDPSPKSIRVDENSSVDSIDIDYPAIVKPTDRSGSRGITRVSDKSELAGAIEAALEHSFEKSALVEEYAQGEEYSVEYISYKGKHYFLALTLKSTTGEPHYIETGHIEPAPVDAETLDRVKAVINHALDTLEIEFGASHSEVKIDENGKIAIIEIGGRMGGDYIGSDLVELSTGYDFVGNVIKIALGEEPELPDYSISRPVKVVFILEEEDITAYRELQSKSPESIIRADVPDHVDSLATDSSSRSGYYIYWLKQ